MNVKIAPKINIKTVTASTRLNLDEALIVGLIKVNRFLPLILSEHNFKTFDRACPALLITRHARWD
jgi:hypothetical protein